MPECGRMSRHRLGDRLQHVRRAPAHRFVLQDFSETSEELGGERRARGRCVVGYVARPRDEYFMIARRVKECASGVVPEPRHSGIGKRSGTSKPNLIEGELIEGERGQSESGVVFEIATELSDSIIV